MKKIFLSLFFLFSFFIFAANNNFKSEYDDVLDVTVTIHKDLEKKSFYNLMDSITGERVNLSLYLVDKDLVLSVDYQFSNWAFFEKLVLLGAGERLVIELKNRTSANKADIVRERYSVFIPADTAELVKKIMSDNNCTISLLGDKRQVRKLPIKNKIRNAINETIELFFKN